MISAERRQSPRMDVDGIAYINLENGGTILNISETGLCFQSTTPVPQAATIQLLFPQDQRQGEADCRPAWVDETQNKGALRLIEVDSELAWVDETRKRGGLRFINLTAETRVQLRNWIRQNTMPVTVNRKSAHPLSWPAISRLVLVPILFTLGVALLRLGGELRRWPSAWSDTTSAMVGITWLLPTIFGFYFAWRLGREGERIERVDRAFFLGLVGVVLNQLMGAAALRYADMGVYSRLVILGTVTIISTYLQYFAWPTLCKTLIAYGVGARIPVAAVMLFLFALAGHWGTHYDQPPGPLARSFWPTFPWFGFFGELIFRVSFTVALGSLAGSVAAALAKRRMRESQAAV
jgi:PilZ domain